MTTRTKLQILQDNLAARQCECNSGILVTPSMQLRFEILLYRHFGLENMAKHDTRFTYYKG